MPIYLISARLFDILQQMDDIIRRPGKAARRGRDSSGPFPD